MKPIKDDLYGVYDIEEVLFELLESPPVQRLKGVHQGGASYLVNKRWNTTRYDHSVGVMLLIRRLGGSIEEQMAGLLHDVSHTAFSHVIDFALGKKAENYHEQIYDQVVEKSSIPAILHKHGYDHRFILQDLDQWGILEQPAPDLCADRIDYTLRDLYHFGQINLAEIQSFLKELSVKEGKICLLSIDMAEWFTKVYYEEVIDFFFHPLNVYANDRMARALKLALEDDVLTEDQLLEEDETVIQLLRASDHPQVLRLLAQLNDEVQVEENEQDYDLHRTGKTRMIDPLHYRNGSTERSSIRSTYIDEMKEKAKLKSTKGTYVKIIDGGLSSVGISS